MKKILVALMALLLLAVGTNAAFEKTNIYANNFSDVAETSWYAENVKTAYELGFMNGKSEGKFDPDGNVTLAEAITMASRVHAIYNGTEVTKRPVSKSQLRYDFDSMDGVRLNHATGSVKDSVLVMQPDKPNAAGSYDPGIIMQKMSLDTRRYNKMTIRMKRDFLPNPKPDAPRKERMEIFFATSVDTKFDEKKLIYYTPAEGTNLEDWFDVEIELSQHQFWQENLVSLRFDPTNNNGVYYIDYIAFSESENPQNQKWYDMYVDYALDNGIIKDAQYERNEVTRNATRSEICDLFASALPEEYFNAINDVKGIPDVLRDSKNADTYLMLYKAGVLLGSDKEGTFNGKADVKRSEVATIINRVALPENRVKGTVSADWTTQGNVYDLEFDDEKALESIIIGECDSAEVKDGALIVKPTDRGEGKKPRFDPKFTVSNIAVDAEEFSKLMVRMKVEYIGDIDYQTFDFYFTTEEGEAFNEGKSVHQDFREYSYLDPFGWYVLEVDLLKDSDWKGTVNSFRFDPANTNGIFTIDYIRFAKGDILRGASHEVLVNEGYTATRLLKDEGFERGFYVAQVEQKNALDHGIWQDYCETDEKPLWKIDPYWSLYDLWDNKNPEDDKYTISDTYGVNTIKYNPDEKSISLRLNATNIYKGEPHINSEYKWWPHLLIEQDREFCAIDKERNSAGADRMFFEIDARVTDFKPTTNPAGVNTCVAMAVFYLRTDKSPTDFVWFCIQLALPSDLSMPNHKTGWTPDTAANQYMYGLRQTTLFNGMKNSFNNEPGKMLLNEWKNIRLDITPHLEQVVAWANRDNIFGLQVTRDDLYISGVNLGYEIHGNYDLTMEFKNMNMVAYNKD